MAEQQLPVWNNGGIEPPANLQQDGWQPGVKPPAQYFDWLFNRAYKCLEELQAITESLEINKANGTELTTLNNTLTQHLAQRNEESYILSPKDKHPSETDYTNALQRVVDRYTSVFLPMELGTISVGKIDITKPLKIRSNGAIINALSNIVFNLSDSAVTFFDVEGLEFKTSEEGSQEVYAIKSADTKMRDIRIVDNHFRHLAVELFIDDVVSTNIFVGNNKWYADERAYNTNQFGYLCVAKNNAIPGIYYDLSTIINQNVFDVYCKDGINVDLCKIGGASQEVVVSENYFVNKNLKSDAQVDTFIGGHKVKFINNNLRNVSYIRKEEQGGTTAIFRYSYDTIDNNTFEVDANSVISNILNVRGSLFKVTNNNIICRNANRYISAINITSGADVYDEFNTKESMYPVVHGNLIDMRSTTANGAFQMYPLQILNTQNAHVTNNILLGGNTLAVNGRNSFTDNSWRPNTDVDVIGINSSRLSGLVNNPDAIIRDNRIDGHEALASLLRINETNSVISHNTTISNATSRHNRSVDVSSNSSANLTSTKVVGSAFTTNNSPYSVAGGYASSGAPSTANRKWHIYSQTGNIEIAGALISSHVFSDYGEYFPNGTGSEIPLGTLVTLDGYSVKLANNDDIVGVVSATAGVALGDTPFSWQGRFSRTEFGEIIYDEILNDENEIVKVPRENPDYNPEAEQIPRSQRKKEWTLVGLMGQVFVRVDESVQEGDYLTAKNGIGIKSDLKTSLRVLKKTNDNVAYCFIK